MTKPEFKQYENVFFNGVRAQIVAVNPISKTYNVRAANSLAQNVEAKDIFETYDEWKAAHESDPLVKPVDLLAWHRPPVAPRPVTPKLENKPKQAGDQTIIFPMSKIEAQTLVNQIRSGFNAIGDKLLQLYERDGWKALGYANWRDCARAEFPFEQSRAYQLLDAARVERNISTNGGNLPAPTSERQIRPLVGLEPVQQVEAYAAAVEKNNGDVPSGAQVEAAVAELTVTPTGALVDTDGEILNRPLPPEKSNTLKALQSSESNEWYTPAKYVEAARSLMGEITLDPASCEFANQTVKAGQFFAKETDGFSREWSGRVWMNPPYGREQGESNQARWSAKLIEEFEAGRVQEAVMLVNAVTERVWFQPLWNYAICFTDHRIEFENESGEDSDPTHGNALIYFGKDVNGFFQHFNQFGRIVVPHGVLSEVL